MTADAGAAAAEPAEEDGLLVLDGLVLADGTVPVLTGIASLGVEPRTPEDIAAFELPPVGYDPYMFRIEPEPLRDRRPAELFLLEPYAPIGVRRPGLVIFPQAQIAGLATNNVLRSPARQGDAALEVRSDLRAVTDWRRHALEFRAAGAAAFFAGHPSEDDRAYALEARGRLDIGPRTNLEALISHQLEKDTRSAPNAPLAAAERGDLEVDRAAVTFNHRFNRLAFQLRAAIREFDFAPVPSLAGASISNDARDLLARDAAFRTTWDFGGGFGVFLETAVDDRSYHTPAADGLSRSSTGEQYRTGLAFAPLSNIIRGEVSLGWGRQRPNEAALPELDGVLIDANLAWRASPLTSFLFTAQSTFVDSIAFASSGGLARLLGLEVRHAFQRDLIGTAGVRYTTTPYAGIPLRETEPSITTWAPPPSCSDATNISPSIRPCPRANPTRTFCASVCACATSAPVRPCLTASQVARADLAPGPHAPRRGRRWPTRTPAVPHSRKSPRRSAWQKKVRAWPNCAWHR